jgi:hypothetical protein
MVVLGGEVVSDEQGTLAQEFLEIKDTNHPSGASMLRHSPTVGTWGGECS